MELGKTIFNLLPCDNEFEEEFARFLNASDEVLAFANLGNLPGRLSIEHLDREANLRQYEPDFVARDANGTHWLIEIKGREDIDVARKNERASQWCEDVTLLTGKPWKFVMVPQKEFIPFKPGSFAELIAGLTAGSNLFVMEDSVQR